VKPVRLALLAALVACLLGPTVASASANSHRRTHTINGTESDPAGVQPDGAGCSIAAHGCRVNLTGHANYEGGIRGTAAYVLHVDPLPQADGLHYTGVAHLDRVTTPCGTGSMDVDLNGVYQTTTVDVATHTTTLIEQGVVRGGPGHLTGMTGRYTATVRDHNDTKTDGTYTGEVTCAA